MLFYARKVLFGLCINLFFVHKNTLLFNILERLSPADCLASTWSHFVMSKIFGCSLTFHLPKSFYCITFALAFFT
jgi:hypothetical protein